MRASEEITDQKLTTRDFDDAACDVGVGHQVQRCVPNIRTRAKSSRREGTLARTPSRSASGRKSHI
jgi:hypothetical protein